jgi:2-polyprenyl-3-methyl-5-hydroxy-6-metoxy-1,4-benzoquinol methylase
MILKRELPQNYINWNLRHKAPLGPFWWLHLRPALLKKFLWKHRMKLPFWVIKAIGPFGFQGNSLTRIVEYPFSYFATNLETGMDVLEIGAGASGFQFCLSEMGINVTSIDPLENPSQEVDWRFSHMDLKKLNHAFGGRVNFVRAKIQNVRLKSNTFDRVYAISVLEHLRENDISQIMQCIADILKPGGYFIGTLDLFMKLAPFTDVESNIFGKNISIKTLFDPAYFEMVIGNKYELYGYDEFVPDEISARVSRKEFYTYDQVVSQCVVLKKKDR